MAKRLGSLDWKVWDDEARDTTHLVEEDHGVQLRGFVVPGNPTFNVPGVNYYFICRPRGGPAYEDMVTEASDNEFDMRMLYAFVVSETLD